MGVYKLVLDSGSENERIELFVIMVIHDAYKVLLVRRNRTLGISALFHEDGDFDGAFVHSFFLLLW